MTAVNLPFTKNKLQVIARDLYLENGWKMPPGLSQAQSGDPRNYTHAQWQQAKRSGKEPKVLKATFAECWAVSDTQAGFAHALDEHGLILAKGDRRGFVAVDFQGEVYSIAKWVGIKAKDVRARLSDQDTLPSVDEARESMQAALSENLKKLASRQNAVFAMRFKELTAKRKALVAAHRTERESLQTIREKRQFAEQLERQALYRKGLRGLLDKLTGKRRKIKADNNVAFEKAEQRDREEMDSLIFAQLEAIGVLDNRITRLDHMRENRIRTLETEISEFAPQHQPNAAEISKSQVHQHINPTVLMQGR